MERDRITEARIEECVSEYKIVPHGVHKEKGINTLCKELDRLLKEVYRCHKRIDKLIGKKHQEIDVSDRVVYTMKYPTCSSTDSFIDFTCKHATAHHLKTESYTISSEFVTSYDYFKASELACVIVTDLRKIIALLLWLHKYGVVNDHYALKDNRIQVFVKSKHLADGGNIVYLNDCCTFTISRAFDRRISYSKQTRCTCRRDSNGRWVYDWINK